jgi:hypothetical protein
LKPSVKEKNNPMLLFENIEPLLIPAIIAGIFLVLLLCISLTILTLLIRNRVNKMNMRLEKVMSALQIEAPSRSEEKETSSKDIKGLQLDENDIKKLKNIGVGME